MDKRDDTGRYMPGNSPRVRGARGKTKRTIMLEAIHAEIKCEAGEYFDSKEEAETAYMRVMVRRSLDVNDRASSVLTKEVMDRLCPVDKATLPTYEIDIPADASPAERIAAVIEAVGRGDVPPDVGNLVVNMISAGVKVEETTELMQRLEQLEKLLLEIERE